MHVRQLARCTATVALALLAVAHPRSQGASQTREQGWAVRQSLNNPTVKLYNNVKQKLLDGKQVATFTISRLDTKLYCDARPAPDQSLLPSYGSLTNPKATFKKPL
jgi:hypothetical protein